jgi:hypothetical protein
MIEFFFIMASLEKSPLKSERENRANFRCLSPGAFGRGEYRKFARFFSE